MDYRYRSNQPHGIKIKILTSNSMIRIKDPKHVSLPTVEVTDITHIGSYSICLRSFITNMFHFPEFKYIYYQ